MFDGYCTACGTRVLLTTRRIISLHNTSEGIVVYFRCWANHVGWFVTGRQTSRRSVAQRVSS